MLKWKYVRSEMTVLCVLSVVILFFMISPIIMVVVISFTNAETLAFPPPDWGFRWYDSVIHLLAEGMETSGGGDRLLESLMTSVGIAVTVMLLSLITGLPAAYVLTRVSFRGKLFVEQIVSLPLIFPMVVLGIALLVMVSYLKLELGFWRIVTGHVIWTLPFVVRNCTASLHGLTPNLEEAARTLGASWWRIGLEIVIPLMRSGIVAGGLIAFVLSFNEFTISYFLYTVDVQPFPIWLFSHSDTSLDPSIFALSSCIIILDVIMVLALDRIVGGEKIAL